MRIVNTEETTEIWKIQYYNCWSSALCYYLIENKYIPVDSFVSDKNGKLCWKFVKSKQLSELLTNFSNSEEIRNRCRGKIHEQK